MSKFTTPSLPPQPFRPFRRARAQMNMKDLNRNPRAFTLIELLVVNWRVSYFLGVDASENNPEMMLAGDRNIYPQGPGQAALPIAIPNNGYGALQNSAVALGATFAAGVATPAWTGKMHQNNGNVLLSDGSAQGLTSSKLRDQLSNSGDPNTLAQGPNTLAFP